MKKILTLILLFLCCKTYSQSTFAPVGTYWQYNVSSWNQPMPGYTVKVIKDTTSIYGVVWKQIESTQSSMKKYSYITSIQDSVWYSDDLLPPYIFLYEFNAKVGDSFQTLGPSPATDLTIFRVDSVKTQYIASANRKVLYLSMNCQNSVINRVTIIENIGPLESIVTSTGSLCSKSTDPDYYYLNCFNDKQGSYPANCKLSTSITESTPHAFNIFPNPVENQLAIKAETPFDKIELYNSNGKLVLSNELGSVLELKLDLSSYTLPAGIYNIKFFSNGSSIGSEKISITY